MNSVLSQMQDLVSGKLRTNSLILNTCRLDVFGSTLFGHKAIIEYFIEHPLRGCFESPHQLFSKNLCVLMGVDQNNNQFGIFTESVDNNILRIWVVGPKKSIIQHSNYVSVPFDPISSQVKTPVAFDPKDHHELSASGAKHLQSLANDLCEYSSSNTDEFVSRRSAFIVRAFSDEEKGAALVALHDLQPSQIRKSSFHFMVITFRFDESQILHTLIAEDLIPDKEWKPRIIQNIPQESVE